MPSGRDGVTTSKESAASENYVEALDEFREPGWEGDGYRSAVLLVARSSNALSGDFIARQRHIDQLSINSMN